MKYQIINIIINCNYTQYLEIEINNILARKLSKSLNFEIEFKIILINIFLKSSYYNQDLKFQIFLITYIIRKYNILSEIILEN